MIHADKQTAQQVSFPNICSYWLCYGEVGDMGQEHSFLMQGTDLQLESGQLQSEDKSVSSPIVLL